MNPNTSKITVPDRKVNRLATMGERLIVDAREFWSDIMSRSPRIWA